MLQEGKLNPEQFALAMYLVQQKQAGKAPPAQLTPDMVPPSMRPKAINPNFSTFFYNVITCTSPGVKVEPRSYSKPNDPSSPPMIIPKKLDGPLEITYSYSVKFIVSSVLFTLSVLMTTD